MQHFLLTALGGAIGATVRYGLGRWVQEARRHGLAGATVLRGTTGFGAHSRIHSAKILQLSEDLPIVIEIVDTPGKIEAFLPLVDGAIHEGLATVEKVQVRFYRSRAAHP